MKNVHVKHSISGVFVFLLLGLFALFSTVLVLIGASAYNSSTEYSDEHNQERVAAAFIRGRLREADEQGLLTEKDIDGADMLKIINSPEGTATILYVYDGTLYEWYTLASLAQRFEVPDPPGSAQTAQDAASSVPENVPAVVVQTASGESICPLDEMTVSMKGNLVTVHLRNGTQWTDVEYAVRCAQP